VAGVGLKFKVECLRLDKNYRLIGSAMAIRKFEDLEIWREARTLSEIVFQLKRKGTFKNDFILRNQIRGASGPAMDNIAEGFERNGKRDFSRFLSIAKGSCGETRSQVYWAFDYNHITQDDFEDLVRRCIRLSKKISLLTGCLKNSNLSGPKYKQP
jgi:four helix bundle protein